jgi:hypothetical protein
MRFDEIMKPNSHLCLALVLSGGLLGCSAIAQDTPEPTNWHGFLMLPSITNADFSITHPISVRVPTKLQIERTADTLSVTIDTNGFESTNLMVGTNVVTVVLEKLFIYPAGAPRPTNSAYGAQGQLDFDLGGLLFHTERDGLPQPGKSYVVEADLTAFETDAPRGHFPIFPWSTNYEIIWQRTLKQTVK